MKRSKHDKIYYEDLEVPTIFIPIIEAMKIPKTT